MPGHLFVSQGDLTRLAADAIAFSASCYLGRDGNLCSAFEANVHGFANWFRELRQQHRETLPVGSTFWMPLDGPEKPQGVVLVVSTGSDKHPDKPGLAVANAIDTAVANLRAAGRTDRLQIALPAFRVGRGGDYRQRTQSALAQVQAARSALDKHPDIDVAFLTYTPALYRIFLEARRSVFGAPADRRGYPGLERSLEVGSCVLFVGAGLSRGAGLPDWNDLIARLSHDLQIDGSATHDHLDLAQWYREQFGNDRLADVLRSTFGGEGRPTLAHYLLMSLPVRMVITTNYDCLLEQVLTALKRHPIPVIHQQDVPHTGGAGVYVVKLHGDAQHPADIVLSRDDYQDFFEKRPAMASLLEGLLLNQTFFFVGYSLRDQNFRQMFHRIARMLKESQRPAFATTFGAEGNAAEYLKRQWRRQQLELIPVPGTTPEEQKREFLRFVDVLSEEVMLRLPPLALAADVPASPRLERLRAVCFEVGLEVEALVEGGAAGEDIGFLTQVVTFLTAHGWRPSRGRSLCRMYEKLANATADPEQRKRLLVTALGTAEAFAEVRRLREELER